jgi:hypothetical protein
MPADTEHDNVDVKNLSFETTEQAPVPANGIRTYNPSNKFLTM